MENGERDMPPKPYQRNILQPYNKPSDSELHGNDPSAKARLLMELVGVGSDAVESIYSTRRGRKPDSSNLSIKIRNLRGYEIIPEEQQLGANTALLGKLEDSEPISKACYEGLIARRKLLNPPVSMDTKIIEWSFPAQNSSTTSLRTKGLASFYSSYKKLVTRQKNEYQSLIIVLPLGSTSQSLKKKYQWHFIDKTYNDITSDDALAIITALQILNDGEENTKLEEIIRKTKLKDYFHIQALNPTSNRYCLHTLFSCNNIKKYSRVRFSLGGKYQFSAKKMFAREQASNDIERVSHYMSIMASHTDGLVMTVRIPLMDDIKPTKPFLYAPRYWVGILSESGTNKWPTSARHDFEKAKKLAAEGDDSVPIFEYDFDDL